MRGNEVVLEGPCGVDFKMPRTGTNEKLSPHGSSCLGTMADPFSFLPVDGDPCLGGTGQPATLPWLQRPAPSHCPGTLRPSRCNTSLVSGSPTTREELASDGRWFKKFEKHGPTLSKGQVASEGNTPERVFLGAGESIFWGDRGIDLPAFMT